MCVCVCVGHTSVYMKYYLHAMFSSKLLYFLQEIQTASAFSISVISALRAFSMSQSASVKGTIQPQLSFGRLRLMLIHPKTPFKPGV